jgi:hypothetical protein
MSKSDRVRGQRDKAGGKSSRRAKPSSPSPTGEAPGPDRDELLHALKVFRRVSEELATWEPVLIGAARGRGGTWTEIAQALGLASRQAAERRFLRLDPGVGDRPGTTREQRVQTTRDRRSGDRAVAAWARQNAAQLRELAGQISVLPARAQGGRAVREAIHAALGEDDAAALLAPLSAAAPYLQRGHHDLAEQVRAVDRKTARIRSADQDQRSPTRPDRPDAAK